MRLRLVLLASFVTLGASAGCARDDSRSGIAIGDDEIIGVPQTEVERQSIGHSWLYAHARWVEALHARATGRTEAFSPAYWTYWHWFDQIAGGAGARISTGGNWLTANAIVAAYGLAPAAAFVAEDPATDMAERARSAIAFIDESLANGVLKDPKARRDRKVVRRELDRAWGLAPDVVATLDRVFGEEVTRTFDSPSARADASGTPILRAEDVEVAFAEGAGKALVARRLSHAMATFAQIYYDTSDRRSFLLRVQNAVHDGQPVLLSWFVDFNALETREAQVGAPRGSFNVATLKAQGPGTQGGHAAIIEGYQARLSDGRLVDVGTEGSPSPSPIARAEPSEEDGRLDAALDRSSEVVFLRVKNAWGVARPERARLPDMPDHHDLYLGYLDGPVQRCEQFDGVTDTSNCRTTTTPLKSVLLPPGY